MINVLVELMSLKLRVSFESIDWKYIYFRNEIFNFEHFKKENETFNFGWKEYCIMLLNLQN